MEIRTEMINEVARSAFLEKLDLAFSRELPDYKAINMSERFEFLAAASELAERKGLKSEQGIASYALAIWYLDLDFEEKSSELESLLLGPFPEVRKVHALNKWVEAVIGDPDNIAEADEALKRSLKLTEPWGAA